MDFISIVEDTRICIYDKLCNEYDYVLIVSLGCTCKQLYKETLAYTKRLPTTQILSFHKSLSHDENINLLIWSFAAGMKNLSVEDVSILSIRYASVAVLSKLTFEAISYSGFTKVKLDGVLGYINNDVICDALGECGNWDIIMTYGKFLFGRNVRYVYHVFHYLVQYDQVNIIEKCLTNKNFSSGCVWEDLITHIKQTLACRSSHNLGWITKRNALCITKFLLSYSDYDYVYPWDIAYGKKHTVEIMLLLHNAGLLSLGLATFTYAAKLFDHNVMLLHKNLLSDNSMTSIIEKISIVDILYLYITLNEINNISFPPNNALEWLCSETHIPISYVLMRVFIRIIATQTICIENIKYVANTFSLYYPKWCDISIIAQYPFKSYIKELFLTNYTEHNDLIYNFLLQIAHKHY